MFMVTKRDGREVSFDRTKIEKAVLAAFKDADGYINDYANEKATKIADYVEKTVMEHPEKIYSIEEIQDLVENGLMASRRKDVAQKYIIYRYNRNMARKTNIDDTIFRIVGGTDDYWRFENSNKNTDIAPTQRDNIAGELSRDISARYLIPKYIMDAHNEGIIHFHDMDYFLQKIHNCCLINLKDMLENNTVISTVLIETPHTFQKACNVATQIIAQVASSQYGGQSVNLAHLAPFIQRTRDTYKKEFPDFTDEQIERLTLRNIKDGVQTIQYQILTLMTTNGQAPFVTIYMNINDAEEGKERDDFALIIEEVLRQRIQGVKNEKGVYVTPTFPKLIYALDENNIHPDSEYYYLTKIAAECTAKRMVPDYISNKKQRELKSGDEYACMGCVEGSEVITYKIGDILFVESFERMWDKLSIFYRIKLQPGRKNDYYMDLDDKVTIYDKEKGFVKVHRIIRNYSTNWVNVKMSNGYTLTCTVDHPFHTKNRGRVLANELIINKDVVSLNTSQYSEELIDMDPDLAWALGLILTDGNYKDELVIEINKKNIDLLISTIEKYLNHNIEYEYSYNYSYLGEDYTTMRIFITYKEKYNFIRLFEGLEKSERHIPTVIFSTSKETKIAFLKGMMNAEEYLNNKSELSTFKIYEFNKELLIQQILLIQSLGINDDLYDSQSNKISVTDEATIVSVVYLNKIDYSYDVTTESDHFDVSGIYSHNCRSFLTVDRTTENYANSGTWNTEKNHKYWGRFNQGVVTINLVDVALSSKGNFDDFWEILDQRLTICHEALRVRHKRLKGTPTTIAPILWQYGALARLSKYDTIDQLLYHGYSTISLGYAGLYECTKYMTGESHINGTEESKDFAIKVMQALNDACAKWKKEEDIDYSVYGTPLESTTYKFAKKLRERFGVIKDITDRDYITNSYHICVREEINAFDKLSKEAEFQELSPGGAISYVEVPNLQGNIEAVLTLMNHIYENILYAELNTKSDYCEECGYSGEIKIKGEQGKYYWECPNCGNKDIKKMSVVRRTCGYLGANFWNQGRTEEILERVLHL